MFSMKRLLFIPVLVALLVQQWGCTKYADDYKDYLENKEIVYPGLAKNVRYQAGNLRTKLIWNPSPDPNISHYMVSWNNGNKTMRVEATSNSVQDSIVAIVPDLAEYVYSFTVTSMDKDGNKSIGQQVHNVRVYGSNYQSILLNRLPNVQSPYEMTNDGQLRLKFAVADSMNVTTRVSYETIAGEQKNLYLSNKDNNLILPNYKYGTAIRYRSGYAPEAHAIDTIYTLTDAVYPTVLRLANKALFKAFALPSDAGTGWGWVLSNIWNYSYDEPGYHSDDSGMPASFTIDMGQNYTLAKVKMWQRMSSVYDSGNPKTIEIWGSNTPAADGTWDSWTKLGAYTITKPSGSPRGTNTDEDIRVAKNGHDLEITAVEKSVRYLRFKVLETWGGNNYVHIIEITPFSKD